MKQYIFTLQKNRTVILDTTERLTSYQYNLIPISHNNNIIWNMGHTLSVSESYLFKHSGFIAPKHQFDMSIFKRGTRPTKEVTLTEINLIRSALHDTFSIFEKYIIRPDSYYADHDDNIKVNPNTIDRALQFLIFHEEMHYSAVTSILKYVLESKENELWD